MPSFDIVSEIDMHEVTNAVDQAKRELGNRWDFKNVEADIELDDKGITISAEQEFQLEQLLDMLRMAFAKRPAPWLRTETASLASWSNSTCY